MSGIDFVENPNDHKAGKGTTVTSSGIEYTNPEIDEPVKAAKPKRSFFGLFGKKKKSNPASAAQAKPKEEEVAEAKEFAPKLDGYTKHKPNRNTAVDDSQNAVGENVATQDVNASSFAPQMPEHQADVSAVMPPTPKPKKATTPIERMPEPKAAVLPDAMTATKKAPIKSDPQPMPQSAPQPAPLRPKLSVDDLPAAPAPASKPEAKAEEVIEPVASATPQASAPAMPAPAAPVNSPVNNMANAMPGVAAAPSNLPNTMASAPAPERMKLDDTVGVIHAQNIEEMSGELTNPEQADESPFAINLLPSLAGGSVPKPTSPISKLIHTATASIVVVLIAYGGIAIYRGVLLQQTRELYTESASVEQEIRSYASLQEDISNTNRTVEEVASVISNHLYWSNVFAVLEEYTLPNVQYASISGASNGTLTMLALTSNFASVSQQAEIFNSAPEVFESVAIASATAVQADTTEGEDASGAVSFSITLSLQPEVLQYQSITPQP